MIHTSRQSGMVHPLLVASIVLGVLTIALSGFGIWAFINYQDQKNNVDAKVAVAVSEAKRQQNEENQRAFAEQEKQPTRQLVGPADLGRVTFMYPKTWSVYVDRDGSGGTYEAYLHPQIVPALSSNTPYALRVSVVNNRYESVVASFNERVKNGQLRSSPATIAEVDGVRLDGAFSNTVRGSMVLFKIRDKTLQVYTQAEAYTSDFNDIILKSLEFNK